MTFPVSGTYKDVCTADDVPCVWHTYVVCKEMCEYQAHVLQQYRAEFPIRFPSSVLSICQLEFPSLIEHYMKCEAPCANTALQGMWDFRHL